jgi:hypothetical protein
MENIWMRSMRSMRWGLDASYEVNAIPKHTWVQIMLTHTHTYMHACMRKDTLSCHANKHIHVHTYTDRKRTHECNSCRQKVLEYITMHTCANSYEQVCVHSNLRLIHTNVSGLAMQD